MTKPLEPTNDTLYQAVAEAKEPMTLSKAGNAGVYLISQPFVHNVIVSGILAGSVMVLDGSEYKTYLCIMTQNSPSK